MNTLVIGSIARLNLCVTELGAYTFNSNEVHCTVRFFTKLSDIRTLKKDQMTAVDADNYICYVPTAGLSGGPLIADIEVTLPDEGSPTGYRTEILRRPTGILLIQ